MFWKFASGLVVLKFATLDNDIFNWFPINVAIFSAKSVIVGVISDAGAGGLLIFWISFVPWIIIFAIFSPISLDKFTSDSDAGKVNLSNQVPPK